MFCRTLISLAVALALLAPELACGPNCQKILSSKKPADLAYEDSVRINGFVERRKAAMDAAKGGNMYVIEDAKRTVTACEMAIELQLQIGNLAKEGSPLYEKNLSKVNDVRCFFDEVLASKGKLIGTGKEAFLSSSNSRKIRSYLEEFGHLVGNEGAVSERRLVETYKKGVKAKKATSESTTAKDGEATEGEAEAGEGEKSTAEAEAEDEGVGNDWGEVSDEGEGEKDESESSDDAMDSF